MKKLFFLLSILLAIFSLIFIAGVLEMTSTQTVLFVGIMLFISMFMMPKGVTTVQAVTPIYASEIISGFDVWKPEILQDLFKRYGDQGMSYFMMLKSMGFEKPVAQDTFSHFEDNLKNPTFKVRSNVAAPGAGNPALITLAAADLDADNRFYPRLWDVVFFKNEVTGVIVDIDVTTPSAPVLTVEPNQSTDNIGALTAGDEVSIISSMFSEGSGQPRGAVTGVEKFTGTMQIIKESIEATGTELTNQTWLRLNGIDGAPLYTEATADMEYRYALKCEGALLFQKATTNSIIDPATGRPVKSTEGLVPYIRRVGNPTPYTAGTLTVADFDAIERTMDREFAGNYIMSLNGIDLSQEIENLLKAYFNNTNIIFAQQNVASALFNKDEGLAASVAFSYLRKGERTYMFKRMGSFSNRNTYGILNSKIPEMGMFLPINKKKDPVNSEMVPSIGMRYKAFGPYSRKTEIWDVSGAGPNLKVTDLDKNSSYIRGNIGAQHRGGNQMVLLHT
jgi:hypothetical protein